MAYGLSAVLLVGNLGHDPSGKDVGEARATEFDLAVTRRKGKGGEEHTDWYHCTCWRGLAEVVEKYMQKGDRTTVLGRLQARTYTGRDGTAKTSLEVDVIDLVLPNRADSAESQNGATQPEAARQGADAPRDAQQHPPSDDGDPGSSDAPAEGADSDDLPF